MAPMRARLLTPLAVLAVALASAPGATPAASAVRFQATLTAPTHNPRVGERWRYSITVRSPAGLPMTLPAKQIVIENSRTIDVICLCAVRGTLHHTYRWPRSDRGKRLLFQARIRGPGGTKILNYTVRVS
jgi:hypothetical protein